MTVDFLIIGQGMAGTLLSYELMRAGKSTMVIDGQKKYNTSLVASAVINPLVGKNWTIAKDAERIIPIALETYKSLGLLLNEDFVQAKSTLVFHRDKSAALNFQRQINTGNPYVSVWQEIEHAIWTDHFGIGLVHPVYTIDAKKLLGKWAEYLRSKNAIVAEDFDVQYLQVTKSNVQYKDIVAANIVFCEGAIGRQNPYFPSLNFTQNRGDALLLSIPQLSTEHIYHKDFRLVPHRDGLFWCGSNYIWEYNSLAPNKEWRLQTESELKHWLKLPFETVDHWVAERPTTAGQKPLLLQHPEQPHIYFFNGMGTRGFSAGPTWAKEMSALLHPI